MSDSPFAAFANATLTFHIATGALVTDNKGNVRPGRSTTTVSAMLKQRKPPRTEPQPGTDTDQIYLEGYAVDPMALSDAVRLSRKALLSWDGRLGKFSIFYQGRSPFGVDDVLGDRIRGWFAIGTSVTAPSPDTPVPIVDVNWIRIDSSTTAALNTGYFVDSESLITLTLPTTGTIGNRITVLGVGAGLWRVVAPSGVAIVSGAVTTTQIDSMTGQGDGIELVCQSANLWRVVDIDGNVEVTE